MILHHKIDLMHLFHTRVMILILIIASVPLFGQDIKGASRNQGKRWNQRQIISPGALTPFDKTMLKIAKKAAQECAQALETAINKGIKTEKEIFCPLYFPVMPPTSPRKFVTFYDDYTDTVIPSIEDRYLDRNPHLAYVTLVDRNGYAPSHNAKYSQPISGDSERDFQYSRSKRIFNDIAGYLSGRNRERFLLQIYFRDTGERLADLSVPVWVKGKHWGSLRVGYLIGG
jgi:methyl-accepting chemotaxis protein